MKLTLRSLTYHFATGDVTMALENAMGSGFAITTTEANLTARLPEEVKDGTAVTVWGNDEAIAEAQALLATADGFTAASARDAEQFPEEGFVVAFAPPPTPAPPAPNPPAAPAAETPALP